MALTFSVFIKLVFCFLTYVESFIFPSQSIEQEMPIDLPQFQLILIEESNISTTPLPNIQKADNRIVSHSERVPEA